MVKETADDQLEAEQNYCILLFSDESFDEEDGSRSGEDTADDLLEAELHS